MSDRVGRIPVIIIGLLVCAAALPLIFRSESLTAFVLLAPLLGLGVGAVTPVTNALIADLASTRRLGAAMGVFGTIWDIGEAAGPMIAGFLIGGLGYAATFDVLAAITAAAAVGLMALVRDPKRAAAARAMSKTAIIYALASAALFGVSDSCCQGPARINSPRSAGGSALLRSGYRCCDLHKLR